MLNIVPDTGIPDQPAERAVFSNRTLNLRSVRAIGYDMDYTLIHYDVDEWERGAFDHAKAHLLDNGWPVESIEFDPSRFTLGLTFDLDLGNLVKATRFGYVVRAQHGTALMTFDEQRNAYAEIVIDLGLDRFEFMNTMFELSRADLWTQLVDIHDENPLPEVRSYADLYRAIDEALAASHLEGAVKAEITADPERFVDLDPGVVPMLRDQRLAGKQLLLITNSGWNYTKQMMAYAFDRFCDSGETWRDLFDIVIVSAAKPRFFSDRMPIYRVVDEDASLMLPHDGPLESGHVYFGGNARLVEESLGVASAQLLYVGDHLFGDVHVTKDVLRWRTALIARELEAEVTASIDSSDDQRRLSELMSQKVVLDRRQATLRMERQRDRSRAGELSRKLDDVAAEAIALDEQIGPLAKASAELGHAIWGPLMRSGHDKSLFARQVERYADIYTSRASNLLYETPYGYLRAARGSLPHDIVAGG
jgi:5'-nucleotidase